MYVDYYTYIRSAQWRQRANEAKRRAGYRCQVCNRSSSDVVLNAHHRTYERLGNEHPDDITVLCRDCHELYETNRKLPKPPRQQQTFSSPITQGSKQPAVAQPIARSQGGKQNWTNGLAISAISIVVLLTLLFISFEGSKPLANRSPGVTRTATSSPVASITPTPNLAFGMTRENVKLYQGPGMAYPVAGTLAKDVTVSISGYKICNPHVWYQTSEDRWLLASVIDSDTLDIPNISVPCVPPTPTHPPTATSTTTRIPSTATFTTLPPSATPQPPTATPAPLGCSGGCTSYPNWCAPPIKGNVSYNSGEHIYHVPGQEYYDDTVINPDYGERWFCTEAEATAAGWRRSKR